jgi:sec-independent protein translocase protein TatB
VRPAGGPPAVRKPGGVFRPAGYPDRVFGINGGELLVLLVVAAIVIGPERLPKYAEQLGQWVRRARRFVADTKERVDAELGEESSGVDWSALDPRKYDPRRIVRDALLEDVTKPVAATAAAAQSTWRATDDAWRNRPGSGNGVPAGAGVAAGGATPYDDEAT